MSSYICDPVHFNSMEQAVKMMAYSSEPNFPYSFKGRFAPLYDTKNHTFEQMDECIGGIFNALRTLSVLCVTLQYAHHYEGTLDAEIKEQTDLLMEVKETSKKPLSEVQLYKAICCALYQIETEHLTSIRELTAAEEDALFFLKEMKISLAESIASGTKEYETAQWEVTE